MRDHSLIEVVGRATIAGVLLLTALSPCLAAAADAQAGRELAQRWCSSCHIVDESPKGADTAPPFVAIARRSAGDTAWVKAWLVAPHPPMINPNLSRQQIEDIEAYLGSLAPR